MESQKSAIIDGWQPTTKIGRDLKAALLLLEGQDKDVLEQARLLLNQEPQNITQA